MHISKEQFEQLVKQALESLPEKVSAKMNNVAIFIEDYPSKEQLGKTGKGRNQYTLFGLFEGYGQASRLNFGPVLPDRITIFRKPICRQANSFKEVKEQVISTIKHEIAHHFGSDESGARKAGRV